MTKLTLLKNCLFCGKELQIISSINSKDGHAHAECFVCNRAFRYLDIPTGDFLLIIAEKSPNKTLR